MSVSQWIVYYLYALQNGIKKRWKVILAILAIILIALLYLPKVLATPSGFAIDGEFLTWKKVKHADTYTVTIRKIGETEKRIHTFSKNQLNMDSLYTDGTYEIYVIANTDKFLHKNSKESTTITVLRTSFHHRDVVYYAPTGTKLHIDPNCSSFRGNVYKGTLSQVKETGRTEWCSRCSRHIHNDWDYRESLWEHNYKIIS